jgi:hypothetical protein
MNLLRNAVSRLVCRGKPQTGRRQDRRRAHSRPLIEPLELRAMLSQAHLGAAVLSPPVAGSPPAILSTQAPSRAITDRTSQTGDPRGAVRSDGVRPGANAPSWGAQGLARAVLSSSQTSGKYEINGQVNVQLGGMLG